MKFFDNKSRFVLPIASLLALSWVGCSTTQRVPEVALSQDKSIVILYENDVHCAVDGYAKMAGLRDAVADTAWVQVVSSGDYVQGGPIGALSKGKYIIELMNALRYNAVTLGNHEFDFKSPRLQELMKMFNGQTTCVNYVDKQTGKPVFADYVIQTVGNKKIAYVGVVTPTVLSTMPLAFYDDNGQMIYDLVPDEIFERVQKATDQARNEGADYVIVLSHLSEVRNDSFITSHDLVASTRGIDVVLDGHSHSQIPHVYVKNLDGQDVLITQTGTQFANVGHLLITRDGKFSAKLMDTNSIHHINDTVKALVDSIKSEAKAVTDRHIGHSDVDLLLKDANGREFSRKQESNTANLVTDAFRIVCDADVCILNAGSIRNSIKAGDLTYGDLISLLPYDNFMCTAEVTGQQILGALTANVVSLPHPDGQFPVVSGIHYAVNTQTHDVTDVSILDRQTGTYEPLDMQRVYTIATTDYSLFNGGLRNTLVDCKVLKNSFMHYCDCFVEYFTKHLNGHITDQYASPEGRIIVTGLE